jgi:hypothetical protein
VVRKLTRSLIDGSGFHPAVKEIINPRNYHTCVE